MKQDRDPFIDDTVRKNWCGEPVEYTPTQFPEGYKKPSFTKIPATGLVVEEITMDEFQAAREARLTPVKA